MGMFFYDKPRYGCWSWRFFIKDCFFQEACKNHDINYSKNIWSRLTIDRLFLKEMLYKAWNITIRVLQAYLFYYIVRLVWWFYFKWDK